MSSNCIGDHGPINFAGQPNTDPKNKPTWYLDKIESIPDEGRKLLEEYSHIPSSEVLPHVTQLRDRAFSIRSYPCIGQVLRFLFHNDQIPAQQLYGFDFEPAFVDCGHELFRDKGQFGATLLSGDLLASHETGSELNVLDHQMDIVHVASVLHLWTWDDMIQAAKRLVRFTRPEAGSMIIGNQIGSLNPGEYPLPTSKSFNYRHNDESIQRFWKQVGEETQTEWKVSSAMYMTQAIKDNMNASFADPGMRMIWFQAERVVT